MEFPYNKPYRGPSDFGGSVEHRIPLVQHGKIHHRGVSTYNDMWIPCDIRDPWNVLITPLDLDAAERIAAGGWHLNSLNLYAAASVAADTTIDWATGTAYVIGDVVNNASNDQYICVVAHTASDAAAGFAEDLTAVYWQLASPTYGWLKLTWASQASGEEPDFTYRIEGFTN